MAQRYAPPMTQPIALAATLLLEVALVVPLVRRLGWRPNRTMASLVLIVCAASLLTHPFAWLFIVQWREWQPDYWLRALPVEVGVAVVEGLYYAWILPVARTRGLALGVAANAFSFGCGVAAQQLGWIG